MRASEMTDHDQPVLVLTNDDGINAPGMQALLQAASGLGRCRVIAPCGPFGLRPPGDDASADPDHA